MGILHAQPKLWTRERFQALAETDAFEPGERVELIEGEIIELCPQGPRHSFVIARLNAWLVHNFSHTHQVRVQSPLALGERSQPEPDFVLIPLDRVPGPERHPETADLVVEVSLSSLAYDKNAKASVYAKAGIPEFWLINLVAGQVEVHLDPGPDPSGVFGYRYQQVAARRGQHQVSSRLQPHVLATAEWMLGTP